jgi:hypothetical protein
MHKRRKQFFFEKKNQKTFANGARGRPTTGLNRQKFFASIFQKRRPSF